MSRRDPVTNANLALVGTLRLDAGHAVYHHVPTPELGLRVTVSRPAWRGGLSEAAGTYVTSSRRTRGDGPYTPGP